MSFEIWNWWRGYLGAIGGGGIWDWWRGYLELGFGIFALGFGLNTTAFFHSEWYYRPYTTRISNTLMQFYIIFLLSGGILNSLPLPQVIKEETERTMSWYQGEWQILKSKVRRKV